MPVWAFQLLCICLYVIQACMYLLVCICVYMKYLYTCTSTCIYGISFPIASLSTEDVLFQKFSNGSRDVMMLAILHQINARHDISLEVITLVHTRFPVRKNTQCTLLFVFLKLCGFFRCLMYNYSLTCKPYRRERCRKESPHRILN